MTLAAWSVLLVAGVAAGASACAALIVPFRGLWIAATTGVASLLTLAGATAVVWRLAGRIDTMVASGAIGIGAVLGGFALAAAVWPELARRAEPGRPSIDAIAPADERVRVVVLADAEPERYSPRYVAAMMRELQESDIPVPPEAVRTLFYAQERGRYSKLGMSPARVVARAVAERLSPLLSEEGLEGEATAAFCTGGPSLAEAIAAGFAGGGRRFVVALLAASDSRRSDIARREVDALELWRHGVEVAYTTPLWSSAAITEAVAARILDAFNGAPRDEDGVVLVSEGQPWQWEQTHPAASEHATFLSQRIRAELVRAGMSGDRVRTAWLEWDEPDVTEAVRHLAALGSRRILVVPATLPFDGIDTMIDLRATAEQTSVDDGVHVAVAPAWGDDPVVARALAERILEAERDLP